MKTYEIRYADKAAGYAEVSTEGLYYKFYCRCRLPDNTLHRIFVYAGEKEINLGVCVPNHGEFILEKKLPIKYLGAGELSFYIGKKSAGKGLRIVPVSEDKPFGAIAMLGDAQFVIHEGKPYIQLAQEVASDDAK